MRKTGFTLIELLVVIAIVAILAAAIAPMISTTRYETRVVKVRSDLETYKTATYMFHLDTGRWPPTNSFAQIPRDGRGLIDNRDENGHPIPDWNGPYLNEWKMDPWGHPYGIYIFSQGGPSGYLVKSLGADDEHGGSGANRDISLVITPDMSL